MEGRSMKFRRVGNMAKELKDLDYEKAQNEDLNAKLEYVAMMTDVDIHTDEGGEEDPENV